LVHFRIKRPTEDDKDQLVEFFKTVVVDTFIKEGIEEMVEDLEEEIESKKQYLENDLKSNGELRYFLIAEYGGCIVGIMVPINQTKKFLFLNESCYNKINKKRTVFI